MSSSLPDPIQVPPGLAGFTRHKMGEVSRWRESAKSRRANIRNLAQIEYPHEPERELVRLRMLRAEIDICEGAVRRLAAAIPEAEIVADLLKGVDESKPKPRHEFIREPMRVLPEEEGQEFLIRQDTAGRLVRIRNPHKAASSMKGGITP